MNITAGVLFFFAFIPYIIAILNGETAPSPVTWAIWACVDTLALVAMLKEKAQSGQLIGAVAGAWVITVLAIIYGEPTMGSIEWVSVAGAITGIVLWQRTGHAVFAIICAQLATFIGALPTFANAYADYSIEDPVAWSLWFLSCIFALFAVKKWDVSNALQPITFTIIETVMVLLVVVRPLVT